VRIKGNYEQNLFELLTLPRTMSPMAGLDRKSIQLNERWEKFHFSLLNMDWRKLLIYAYAYKEMSEEYWQKILLFRMKSTKY